MAKKIIKYFIYSILSLILILIVLIMAFVKISPQFGGKHSKSDLVRYEKSGNFIKGKFQNLIETDLDMDFLKLVRITKKFITGVPNQKPSYKLPQEKVDSTELVRHIQSLAPTRLIWFGHSAFLLQIDGKNILIDPMLGSVPSPHPWLGKGRYNKELPIEIEKLPKIDAIILSHDHYDHLDYESIKKLEGKTEAFYLPLGVGAHFKAWGTDESKIHELNWWQEIKLDNILLAFTPSRHFSGRGLSDRYSTLWGSWVIKGQKDNIYFSGDSGYGPHFKEIGEKYGPFDFSMVECGQYNEEWAYIHMMPEETAQAAVDLKSKIFMPIHWGAFTLALHTWNDPVIRVSKKAEELKIPIITPKIGQEIYINKTEGYQERWWLGNK